MASRCNLSRVCPKSRFFKNRIKFFLHILSGIFPVERKLSLSHHLSTFGANWVIIHGLGRCWWLEIVSEWDWGKSRLLWVVRMLRVDCGAKKSIFSEVFFTLHKFVPRAARFPFQLVFLGCLDASLGWEPLKREKGTRSGSDHRSINSGQAFYPQSMEGQMYW